MKKIYYIIGCTLFLWSCNNNQDTASKTTSNAAQFPQSAQIAESFSEIEPIFSIPNDTTYVINFWATSCPPCIKEMPHFTHLEKSYENEKMRLLLVSLDMKRDAESRVTPFIEKHKITPEVVLLADQNYSAWTEKIDSSWYGALPATLIRKNGKSKFFMGAFDTYEDLANEVRPFIESTSD
jgi:thiol-disulfide isomerase/thioredoxin